MAMVRATGCVMIAASIIMVLLVKARPTDSAAAAAVTRPLHSTLHRRLLQQYSDDVDTTFPQLMPKIGLTPRSFDFGIAKYKYQSVQDYCDGELKAMSRGKLRQVYEDAYPLTGNTPRGCVIGCLMGNGIAERLLRRRGLLWSGKCFDPGSRVWNYMIPSFQGNNRSTGGTNNGNNRNVTRFLLRMIPGNYTQGNISWADDKPTIFIDYPPNLYWQAVTMLATLPFSIRYPNFHDEIREVPNSPGLFVGVSWAKPFTFTNFSPVPIVALRFALFQTRSGLDEFDDQLNGVDFFQRSLRSLRRGIEVASGTPSIELKSATTAEWWDGLEPGV